MTQESMAQAVYDIAGSLLYLPYDGDAATFLTLTQGDPITVNVVAEGSARSLRHDTSAFVHVAGYIVPASAGVEGEPIVLDLGPLLLNAQGWQGGIYFGAGMIVGGAGGHVSGSGLIAATWALETDLSRLLVLHDAAGAPITDAIADSGDSIGFNLAFVAVVSD